MLLSPEPSAFPSFSPIFFLAFYLRRRHDGLFLSLLCCLILGDGSGVVQEEMLLCICISACVVV